MSEDPLLDAIREAFACRDRARALRVAGIWERHLEKTVAKEERADLTADITARYVARAELVLLAWRERAADLRALDAVEAA